MKVLGLCDPDTGCGYHRVILPLYALPDADCYIRNYWDEELLKEGIDIVLYNRLLGTSPEDIVRLKQEYGFKVVVDVDDYWILDSTHIIYENYHGEANLSGKIVENIRLADAVTCTHERLVDLIRPINPNVHVIPNALPYDQNQFNAEKIEEEVCRFIYVGGVTHKNDVAILRNPLKKVMSDWRLRAKIKMVFCGYNRFNKETQDAYDSMLDAFTCGLKLNPQIHPSCKVFSYMEFYRNGDVALVPLVDTMFNNMKSNLKILEAGAKYMPVIASNVHPYKDFPHVLYVDKQSDWYRQMKFLADNKELREQIGRQLGEYCREHYHLDKWSVVRKELFDAVQSAKNIFIDERRSETAA